ncbi:MAG TPA: tRNA dihydrouridine synthase DusB [Bacteroidia bacterium]|nr:tRNA dihydrouridine synthase DusB [Bacteroidia bacterium]HRS58659.1 tRNA dihydrouridine synthase DusB [Bacteroidia bacterium]HRU67866.1 tRNA dihydrouridine synthase DusB [Bacteroidia bacterium]
MIKIGQLQFPDPPVVLAPMEDVSDPPFRIICRQMGADMVYSEFISSDGLIRNASKSLIKLDIFPEERPVAIQVFGHDEKSMLEAVEMIEKANPEIIDINFGCPVKKIVRKGAGAAFLLKQDEMVRITGMIVKKTSKPVTVKTRLGWDSQSIGIVNLCEKLQDSGVVAIALHARTAVQVYSGHADWSWFLKIKENQRFKIPLIGNGDIKSPFDAEKMIKEYYVDGVMIGRAAIGNPFIFREISTYLKEGKILSRPDLAERVEVCRKHFTQSATWKGERQAIMEMRKHYKPYFKGIEGCKELKIRLMEATNSDEIHIILDQMKNKYKH